MFEQAVNRCINEIPEELAVPGGEVRVGIRGPAHNFQNERDRCTVLVATLRLPDRRLLELKRSIPLATLCFGNSDEIDALCDTVVEQFNRAIAAHMEGPDDDERFV